MNRMKQFFCDLNHAAWLNFKLLTKNREAMVVLLVSILIFVAVSSSLILVAEERSSVPIGIIDKDQSKTSIQLIEGIKKTGAFFVYSGTKKELDRKLNDSYIMAYFVIDKGFEEDIQKGKTDGLIGIYYLKENESISILSDIFASDMIYDISLVKCIQLYQKFENQYVLKSKTEYITYMDTLKNNSSDNFSFDMKLVNINSNTNANTGDSIRNGLIYVQIVMDLLATLFSFLILFLVYGIKKEGKINERVKITEMNKIALEMGKSVPIMLFISVVAAVCGIYFTQILKITSICQIINDTLLIILFCFTMVELFLLVSTFVTSGILYEFMGSALILLFGGMAGVSLIGVMLSENILLIFKIAPNYWFIEGFTDIIVNGKLASKAIEIDFLFCFAGFGLGALRNIINRSHCQIKND